MATNDSLLLWDAASGVPPSANYATLDLRNDHVVLNFDDATSESIDFSAVVPSTYSGGNGQLVVLTWTATSATSGIVRWLVQIERQDPTAGFDLDVDGFSTEIAVETAVPTAAGEIVQSSLSLASLGISALPHAGEPLRIRVSRDAAHVGDTLVGGAELIAIELREE